MTDIVDTPSPFGFPTSGDWWADIPEARDSAASGERRTELSRVPSVVGAVAPSRRRLLQAAGAIGGALALNVLQGISGVRLPFAAATVGSEWTGCTVYAYSNDIVCTPGGVYSYIYCGGDGWFKNGTFNGGNERYRPIAICNQRNAWRWVHNGIRYRCADGEFSYYRSSGGWTAWQFKICSQWLGPA